MGNKQAYRCFVLLLAFFAVSCGGGIQTLLKSGKPEEMYRQALVYYEKEKWDKATSLFEGAAPYYLGTPREDSISFMHARSKFKSREYSLAAEEFDLFRHKFPRSLFLEDAEGMLALSYYYLSPAPERDQTMTRQALVAINEFLAHYPTGAHSDEFRQMNRELTERLHDKAFLNAYTYYKIERYKSAIVALRNALKLYPQSKHREEIMYLIVRSSHELAHNSVADKQTDRYLSMLDSYYSFVAEYPASEHRRELDRLSGNAKNYLDKNKKTE